MPEFKFSLRFQLGDGEDPSRHLDALAAQGCTDAVVGVGRIGRIALDFSREGPTLLDAIASAVGDVGRAIPNARLIEMPRIAEVITVERSDRSP
jgi:hypothetical protein